MNAYVVDYPGHDVGDNVGLLVTLAGFTGVERLGPDRWIVTTDLQEWDVVELLAPQVAAPGVLRVQLEGQPTPLS